MTFWRTLSSILLLVCWLGPRPSSAADDTENDPFRDCAESFERAPEEVGSADCFYTVARATGLGEEARGRLLAQLARRSQNPSLELNLGLVEYTLEHPSAADRFRAAREGFLARGLSAEAHRAQRSLVSFLRLARRWNEAGAELAVARAMPPVADDPLAVPRLDLQEARLLLAEGRHLGRAYELLDGLGARGLSEAERVETWSVLGTVAFELGRFEDARSAYRRSLALVETGRVEGDRTHLLYNLASVTIGESPGRATREKAIEEMQRALEAAITSKSARTRAPAHLALGRLLEAAPAREHLDACLGLVPSHPLCLAASAQLSSVDDPLSARRQLEIALSEAAKSNDPWSRVFLWPDRLPILWASGSREAAIGASLEVLDEVETLRDRQEVGASRAGFLSVWANAYRWLFGRLLGEDGRSADRRDLERAFDVGERFRARSLLEALDVAGVEAAQPPRLARLGEVQAALGADEALLMFQVAPWRDVYSRFGGGSWLLTIDRDNVRAYRLGERAEIERQVRFYLGLAGKSAAETAKPAARLHRELLERGLAELSPGVDKLILLPDGVLHNLPWNTLRSHPEAPLVAERYELSLISSATLWQRWRQRDPAPAVAPALVLADPMPPRPVLAAGVSSIRSGPTLGPLPRAKREGRAVVRYLGGSSRLLTGLEASEHLLKTVALRDYGLLHIAAHAVVDDTLPQRSFVLLAPGSESEDGQLHMADIVDLDLEGRVVVLAACSGASGQVLQGEGVMSLARAFFQAGARAVVASLWPLEDRAAERLFDAFYRELAQGVSLGQALKTAQRQRIRAGVPVSEWAGVVVLGDASVVPNPGGHAPVPVSLVSRPAVLGGAALLLAALALIAWRRMRSG